MVDVDSALLSVQERDNWRRRMDVLERSLLDVRNQRHKLEVRLQRIRKDLARLRTAAREVVDGSRPTHRLEMMNAPPPRPLHPR
ncbi:MAG: hypothetical protein WBF81_00215 [Thermoplasmata archaeon]